MSRLAEIKKEEIKDLLKKYRYRLDKEMFVPIANPTRPISSREYQEFKKSYYPGNLSFYEALCNLSEKILKVKPDQNKAKIIQEHIDTCHLNITPTGATSFSIFAPIILSLFGAVVSFFLLNSMYFAFFFIMSGFVLYVLFDKLPEFLASSWRLKASNQMVLCIFYVVTYMRHTSNLERAVQFASDHLSPPISLDLKKVLWDVETEKYESVKESLAYYLEGWRKYNMEFVEAFHLIESSLLEPDEKRRVKTLDKALSVMLQETYEKMLHYAHNLKSPITTLHMMGIILPILGLVILPLIVSFMSGIKWYHIAMIYNIILPIGVYYLGKGILAKRPTGYGETDISEEPGLRKYKNILVNIGKTEIQISPFWIAFFIGVMLLLVGLTPVILHYLAPGFDIGIGRKMEPTQSVCGRAFCLLEYRKSIETAKAGQIVGPYGLGATILSLAFPLCIGLSLGIYFKLRSKNVVKIREETKKLEEEFASSLFQLANRMADGLPAEIAVGNVAKLMEGTTSGNFFSLVSTNIRKLGMGIKEAIFNPKIGAILTYPSAVISSSMKVLTESVKKGPLVAAQALMNVSLYLKEIHRVNERLKDLLADIISSMKSQIDFLTPVIAGIVVGITSMVTTIIGKLGGMLTNLQSTGGDVGAGVGGLGTVAEMFGDGVPTYYFQIVIGIYVVQICYILTVLANSIENGADKLGERHSLGTNLIKSTTLYCVVAFLITLLFNVIAMTILSNTMNL